MPRSTLLVAALLFAAPALAQRTNAALAGEWAGTAHITVDWTLRRELDVHVTIRDDGTVSGQIGDATLREGRIRTNRSVVAGAMRLGTDYVIEGRLSGPLIRNEAIERASVRLPVNWSGSTFEGTLATSGSYQPQRTDMVVTAAGLVLRRVGAAPPPASR